MRSKELPEELRDRIVARHRSGQGYKKNSAALKVPKSTVASIRCIREMGESCRKSTITAALHQSGLYGRVARRKTLLSARHMKACMEFAKKTPEGLQVTNW